MKYITLVNHSIKSDYLKHTYETHRLHSVLKCYKLCKCAVGKIAILKKFQSLVRMSGQRKKTEKKDIGNIYIY